jgi:hypothetical protein
LRRIPAFMHNKCTTPPKIKSMASVCACVVGCGKEMNVKRNGKEKKTASVQARRALLNPTAQPHKRPNTHFSLCMDKNHNHKRP